MKIAVYLTVAQIKAITAVPAAFDNRHMQEAKKAASEAYNRYTERVRAAENLIARVRDAESEE